MAAACAVVSLVLNGCAWTSNLDLMLYEGPEGAVFLERFPGGSAHASHPASIDEALIARALGGIRIEEQPTMFEGLLTGPPDPIQAFQDQDIAFLSPLLVEALALAAPDQRVAFRLARTDPSPEIDEGRLYVGNTLLHFLVAKKPRQRGGLGRTLDIWTVSFAPQLAQRDQKAAQEPVRIHPIDGKEAKSLSIDYTVLAHSPPSGSTYGPNDPDDPDDLQRSSGSPRDANLPQENDGAGTAGPGDRSRADELEAVKEHLQEKSREIKALEERVRELQRQMEEGDAGSASPERGTASGR